MGFQSSLLTVNITRSRKEAEKADMICHQIAGVAPVDVELTRPFEENSTPAALGHCFKLNTTNASARAVVNRNSLARYRSQIMTP